MFWFAAMFAGVAALLGTVVEKSASVAAWTDTVSVALLVLNFGGNLLGFMVEGLLPLADSSSPAGWAWTLTARFVGSIPQGLAYALVGLLVLRVYRVSKARAILYPVAIAVITVASFDAGVAHFHRVNCSDGDIGDCDLGFIDGTIWAGTAFAASLLAFMLVEAMIRRARPAPV